MKPLEGQESKSIGSQPCPHAMVEMIHSDRQSSLLGYQIITKKFYSINSQVSMLLNFFSSSLMHRASRLEQALSF
jgi:hypothetical protein